MTRLHRWFTAFLLGLMLMGLSAISHGYESITGPTGLLYYDQAKAYQGYTLLDPLIASKTTYLLDMEGNIVHTWKSEYTPGLHSELLPNGHLLRAGMVEAKPELGAVGIGGHGGIIEEFDWEGNKVWEYKLYTKGKEIQHHTFDRMPNGNTLILAWEAMSKEEAIKAGRDPKTIPTENQIYMGVPHDQFWVDFVREVDTAGKTVWEWHVKDHIGTGPNKFDINYSAPKTLGIEGGFDWTHFNSVAYIPKTDTVVLNSRNFGEFYLINHKTGEIESRWGNPSAWDPKAKKPGFYDDGSQLAFGSHCAMPLKNGNILVFDNGSERPQLRRSRAIEVDPKTGEIVWQFATNHSVSFSSHRQGSVQRLANGNTLICSTHGGHIFEVTKDGQVVWDFVSPIFAGRTKVVVGNNDAIPAVAHMDGMPNMVHRAYRYGVDYPAFFNKTLTPKGYIGGENSPRFYRDYFTGPSLSEPMKPMGKGGPPNSAPQPAAPKAPANHDGISDKQAEEATMKAY